MQCGGSFHHGAYEDVSMKRLLAAIGLGFVAATMSACITI
jgi:hypothetical protein